MSKSVTARRFEYKTPKLPSLPTEHYQTKTWLHKVIQKVEAVSSRTDHSERTYLLRVLEIESPSDLFLQSVPERMIPMDRVLLPELQKICEKDKLLHREVEQENVLSINRGKSLTSVKILHMIMHHLCISDTPN